MGTKSDAFEESTKIKSSAEIDEMLRDAATNRPATFEDDYDEDDFDAHTQIGNVQELVARSAIPDEPPPPLVVGRASTNVIRRATTPNMVARSSNVMAAVMPQGSMPNLPLPAAKTDDEAFAAWDDFDDTSQKAEPIPAADPIPAAEPIWEQAEPSTLVATPPPPAIAMPPINMYEEAPVVYAPVVQAPVVEALAPQTTTVRRKLPVAVVAWVVLLLVTISVGTMSYMRIKQLEGELASARAQINR